MKSSIAALFAACGLAAGQNLLCDGALRPNWDDCADLVEWFEFEDNYDSFHENGKDDAAPSCRWWKWDDGNCRITHCFGSDDEEGRVMTGDSIWLRYNAIRSNCNGYRAGGTDRDHSVSDDGVFGFLQVTNDPDAKRAGKRSLPPAHDVTTHQGGVIEGTTSRELYTEWLDSLSDDPDHRSTAARSIAHQKRDDDDDRVYILFGAINIRNNDKFELGPRMSSGVDYTYSTTNSKTYGVTTSASMGGTWEVFTASVGIEISQEDTFSVTEGLTYSVDCPNMGQVKLYPYYEYWQVQTQPSDTITDIWTPVNAGNKKVSGEIAVECMG